MCLLLGSTLQAQKQQAGDHPELAHPVMQKKATMWFSGKAVNTQDPAASLRQVVFQKFPDVQGSALEIDTVIEGLSGTYYHFHQSIGGQSVYGSQVVAKVSNEGVARNIIANLYPTDWAVGTPLTENEPLSAGEQFRSNYRGVWFNTGTELVPVVRQVVHQHPTFEEQMVDANGTILWSRDLNLHVDTTLIVHVFNPDPLTSVRATYGAPYNDQGDANGSNLDPLREVHEVKGDFNSGSYVLRNNWIVISDFDSPSIAPASRSNNVFDYSRSQDIFEQVNAFYHLTVWQERMRDLGFNLVNYQLPVDANALSGADNSMFSRATNPPRLFFGEGGVDDAEDADVVLHEYGHAISHSASPFSNSGTERGCLDEGFGDYLAASYSRGLSNYGYERVFSWDGHNEFWSGRYAQNRTNKFYPNLSFTSLYTHTDIWSGALMDIWGIMGAGYCDQVVLESMYGYTSNMTMQQAALLVVDADSSLNNGTWVQPIWEAFVRHGILPANAVSINENGQEHAVEFYNTTGFSRGGNLVVKLSDNTPYTFQLIDISGRILHSGKIESTQWSYSGQGLRSGTYTLLLRDSGGRTYHQKLIRLL